MTEDQLKRLMDWVEEQIHYSPDEDDFARDVMELLNEYMKTRDELIAAKAEAKKWHDEWVRALPCMDD